MLQPLCDGTFEEQLAVIQDQEDSEADVSVQTTGKTVPQAPVGPKVNII